MVPPKFKKGDKVRLVKKKHYFENGKDCRPGTREGDVYTIESKPKYFSVMHSYAYEVVESIYLLIEDEIELAAGPEYMTITFDVESGNKKAAHKAAHEAVEAAYAAWEEANKKPVYEDWTEEEIKQAMNCIDKLTHFAIMAGNDVQWAKLNGDEILCTITRIDSERELVGIATKMEEDTYNDWIGKCVSLYHALDIQLPSFIRSKNVKR